MMNIILLLLLYFIIQSYSNECNNYNDKVFKTSDLHRILNNFNDISITDITINDIIKASDEIGNNTPDREESSFRILPKWLLQSLTYYYNKLIY